eukprot:8594229-Pyramimonas_sp.AAC.1
MSWAAEGRTYKLVQCCSDSQVWRLVQQGDEMSTLGLTVVYVDDFMILAERGEAREGLLGQIKAIWSTGKEKTLNDTGGIGTRSGTGGIGTRSGTSGIGAHGGEELNFLGMHMKRTPDGIEVGHTEFIDKILEKHGMSTAHGLTT